MHNYSKHVCTDDLWLHLSPQKCVANVVVLIMSLMKLNMKTCFMRKFVNTTVFFKTRKENSKEKSTLGPKRPKVVSLFRVLENYFRPHFEFFYDFES